MAGDEEATTAESKTRPERIRAQAACVTCRSRRTKCVVEEGETACNYCKTHNRECVIVNDDLRKKRVTQDYVSSLENRIKELEAALRNAGQAVPPVATTTPKRKSASFPPATASANTDRTPENYLSDILDEHFGTQQVQEAVLDPTLEALSESPATNFTTPGKEGAITAAYENLVPFWSSRTTADEFDEGTSLEFLNLCKQAVQERSSSVSNADSAHTPTEWTETLRNQAKDFYDTGKAYPQNLNIVFGLLLLADLEVRATLYEDSWAHFGLAWDTLGEFAMPRNESMDSQMRENTCLLFTSCLMYSRGWTVFGGDRFNRFPNGYEFITLAESHGLSGYVLDVYNSHKVMTTTLSAWLHLIAAEVRWQHLIDFRRSWAATEDPVQFIEADADMGSWYVSLPEHLQWIPESISNANVDFFFLHIYYHSRVILLHWHAATYNVQIDGKTESENSIDIVQCLLSREVCWRNALRIWRVSQVYKATFPIRDGCVPIVQSVILATAAIIASVDKNFKRYEGDAETALRDLSNTMNEICVINSPARLYADEIADAIKCLEEGRLVSTQFERSSPLEGSATFFSELMACTKLVDHSF